MFKKLFVILVDGFEVNVIANDYIEAEEHCYKFFDFSTIKLQDYKEIHTSEMFPCFVEGHKYA
ncbi:hypothetical protein LSA2308_00153 [Staphylococcus phage LSA2308]|nr:hypothetical protein LSA2308_00153 [Staphylococcus phage LSA2308]USZ62859.1 hypothetical protein LSA2311_orf00051 [Staphylococcus phage LSA2311]